MKPETAVDRERAAWLRRRVRLLSAGFLVCIGSSYALSAAGIEGGRTVRAWVHLPQAIVLCAHWLWLYKPRPRREVEWGTVVAWGLGLGGCGLWLVYGVEDAVPQYALGLLVSVMFAAPAAHLSWRATAAVLLAAGLAEVLAVAVRYGGAPPLLIIKNALLTIPGVALVLDAASRDRLEQAEFDARTRLQEANQKLQREERARTRLFVNLSHDFRTPLTLIRGEAQWLRGQLSATGTDQDAALGRIQANSGALADLVEQLLELARLDAGRTPRHEADFVLAEIATEVVAQLRQPGDAVRFAVEDAGPASVARADPAHVRRILFNLVSNGVRALSPRGGLLEVRIARHGSDVVVDVVDDGPGIPVERRGNLFERFSSFDAGGSTVSGIGLPLASELAQLNGGALVILDEEARTTFRLRLPAGVLDQGAIVASLALRDASPPPPVSVEENDTRSPSSFPDDRPSLLVVEDHPEMRALLRKVLGDRYLVRTASSVEDALKELEAEVPRAVVSDVLLGERTGYELLATMHERPWLSAVPVLLVSALADADQRVRGLGAGADDYLAKPFSTDELRARVQAAIDRADARSAALRAQRDAILMELHDGVNAALTRAAILLTSGRSSLSTGGLATAIGDAEAAVREALDESTALLFVIEAVPQRWEEVAADIRRHFAETCERHGLALEFSARSDGSCPQVRPGSGHALRRIAREALTNVIKHAGARRVECHLAADAAMLVLRVEDDGVGFAADAARGRGMGIIARRAEQLDGKAQFANGATGGACVAVRLAS